MQVVAVAPGAVQVPPAGLEVTVYPVMAEPPLLAGSVQVTVTCGAEPLAIPVTSAAEPMVGAWATVAAVTLALADEAVLVPSPLVAVTVKV